MSNLQRLHEAGVKIDAKQLSTQDLAHIESLSATEVQYLASVRAKVGVERPINAVVM